MGNWVGGHFIQGLQITMSNNNNLCTKEHSLNDNITYPFEERFFGYFSCGTLEKLGSIFYCLKMLSCITSSITDQLLSEQSPNTLRFIV